ncbi:MAG: PIN domain-containing protein [Chloroflexi bacterium]|nr:PIN domain-containing protein [Chloroflexota bacterium]
MRILLDTTFLIDHLRGVEAAVDRLELAFADGDEVYINEVAVAETRTGLRARDVRFLEGLIRPLDFVQPGPDAALTAGQWRREARERGADLTVPDALIASAAASVNAAVLTRNERDFALTPVRVLTY